MLRSVLLGLRDNGGVQASQIRVIRPYRVVERYFDKLADPAGAAKGASPVDAP